MLVLKRREQERVRIRWPDGRGGWAGGWITLVRGFPHSARIGFEFDDTVEIDREELVSDEPQPAPTDGDNS